MSKMEEGEGQEGEGQKWESEEFEMEAGRRSFGMGAH